MLSRRISDLLAAAQPSSLDIFEIGTDPESRDEWAQKGVEDVEQYRSRGYRRWKLEEDWEKASVFIMQWSEINMRFAGVWSMENMELDG
jgi:hypothetical protein